MSQSFDQQQLLDCLAHLGWRPEALALGRWRSAHGSDEGEIVVELVLRGAWLVAGVKPFIDVGPEHPLDLSRWLLRQNWDMHQAKFAYGEAGEVLLLVELPTERLDAVEIETALQTLLVQTVAHRRTLREALAAHLSTDGTPQANP